MNRPIIRPVVFLFFAAICLSVFLPLMLVFPGKVLGGHGFLGRMWPFKSFFVRQPSQQEPSQKTMDLHTRKHPIKSMWRWTFSFGVSTFVPRTFPENHVAFQFFLRIDLRAKNLPRKPCGVSFFLWVNLRNKNQPRNPCGVSFFFASRPSRQEPSQKTMWRFGFFCKSIFAPRTFPESHVAFQLFCVSRPSRQEPSQKNHVTILKFAHLTLAEIKFVQLFLPHERKKRDVQAGCWGGPGGIRASDPEVPSLNCLVVHPLNPLKIQNPKSKIRNLKSKIPQSKIQTFSAEFWEFWILDVGFWIVM